MAELLLVILLLERSDLEVKLPVSRSLHEDRLKNHLLTYKQNQFSAATVKENLGNYSAKPHFIRIYTHYFLKMGKRPSDYTLRPKKPKPRCSSPTRLSTPF